jgi:heme/copper-type cytochrome/quinol oxidase subunit 2
MKFKILKVKLYNFLLLASTVVFSQTSLAQSLPSELKPSYIPNIAEGSAEDKIYSFSGNLIITMVQVVGGVAIVLIIFNGIKYTVSRGEDSEIEQSKTNLLWIIGGLVLIMISYVVIRFVVKITLLVDEVN